MTDLQYLKSQGAKYSRGLHTVLETLNKKFPKPDTRWEVDEMEHKIRRVKMPSMEWEQYEEPNDELE